jgi:hypothetical protein
MDIDVAIFLNCAIERGELRNAPRWHRFTLDVDSTEACERRTRERQDKTRTSPEHLHWIYSIDPNSIQWLMYHIQRDGPIALSGKSPANSVPARSEIERTEESWDHAHYCRTMLPMTMQHGLLLRRAMRETAHPMRNFPGHRMGRIPHRRHFEQSWTVVRGQCGMGQIAQSAAESLLGPNSIESGRFQTLFGNARSIDRLNV